MAARRRLMKELQDIRKAGPKYFRDVQVDEQNIFQWQGLLVPEAYPFNKGKLEKCTKSKLLNLFILLDY
jgi:ubiquitin-conjugating enzyme E2 L3